MKIQINFELDWNKSKEEITEDLKSILLQCNMGVLCNKLENKDKEQKIWLAKNNTFVGRINYWRK